MYHNNGCISRSCMGCGPKSEIGKVKAQLTKKLQQNETLLEELKKVREELVIAKERINELESNN